MTRQTKQVLSASPQHSVTVPRELDQQVLTTHYLQPGDELLLELDEIEADIRLPADQQIAADGAIDLGRFGRTKVAGLTLEQAEAQVESTIATIETRQPGVNLRLIQSVDRYYVIGEVNSPGSYPLIGHETVLDGIVAAAGLTPRASACDLLVARPTDPCSCRVTLQVCYRAITQLGDTATNYQLRPGDRIFVGRQSLWEELMQCCCLEESCSRCKKSHTACCDPVVADVEDSNFTTVAAEMISTDFEAAMESEFVPADPVPVQVEELDGPSSSPGAEPTDGSTDLLDGELEF